MTHSDAATGGLGGLFRAIDRRLAAAQPVLSALGLLALRLPVSAVFWSSGRTKVEGWNIFVVNDTQYYLFEEEFKLPFPELMAHLSAIGEHVLPILLVLGLATRLGALGMLFMTLVIQFFVFPDAWFTAHMFWTTITFAVFALGPGKLSLDHLIASRLRR